MWHNQKIIRSFSKRFNKTFVILAKIYKICYHTIQICMLVCIKEGEDYNEL